MARILVTSASVRGPDDPALEPVRRDGHTLTFVETASVRSTPALAAALQGVAATLASVEPYTAEVLAAAPALRVISRTGVGYDAIDLAEATRRGVAVCVTPGTNEHAVADLAVALVLACARKVVAADRHVRAGGWFPQPIGVELRGATVGVVGTGLIGRGVVRRLWGFGPRILAHDVVPSPELVEQLGVAYVPLEELLRTSDVVTLHAPLLASTYHLVNASTLALMKPTASLVNTARGPLVDEAALVEALRAGRIASAALDVFECEPLPADSPLRAEDLQDRLILLPHVAGVTEQSRSAMVLMAAENAARVLRGEAPLACVNSDYAAASGATPAG